MGIVNRVGFVYGRLTILEHQGPRVVCQCSCGNTVTRRSKDLYSGYTNSCGCLRKELAAKAKTIHGMCANKSIPEGHYIWRGMIQRCTNKNSKNFNSYGGRGITVCDRWINSFVNFIADVGQRPSPNHSIDRIDTNGNYEPSNVRWADMVTQARNKRPTSNTGFSGVTKTPSGKFIAYICIANRKQTHLGTFSNLDDAVSERLKAEKLYWPKANANCVELFAAKSADKTKPPSQDCNPRVASNIQE